MQNLTDFRAEVRRFFAQDYPQDILQRLREHRSIDRADHARGQAALAARGWGAPHWPVEHGGTGWSDAERQVFEEEHAAAGAPGVIPMGLIYVAPIIIAFGTAEQQARWLPGILDGSVFWGQGYSEPGAGSDLGSLTTRAVADGADYIVTGTKTWTSLGHWADWIFCLVRTGEGVKGGAGVSFLCIDMNSPGISVRPIIGIDGHPYLATVHFEGVRVPRANLIGEEGQGWSYSRQLLAKERTWYAQVPWKRAALAEIRRLAASHPAPDRPLLAEPAFRRKLTEAATRLTVLEAQVERARGATPREAAPVKVMATETGQYLTELLLDVAGPLATPALPERGQAGWAAGLAAPWAVPAMEEYLFGRAQTIYGGSTEIQKNIMAKQLLGL